MSRQQVFRQECQGAGFEVDLDPVKKTPFVKVSNRELDDLVKILQMTDPPLELEIKKYPKFSIVSPK